MKCEGLVQCNDRPATASMNPTDFFSLSLSHSFESRFCVAAWNQVQQLKAILGPKTLTKNMCACTNVHLEYVYNIIGYVLPDDSCSNSFFSGLIFNQ